VLLSLQLVVGRDQPWLPDRWLRLRLDGEKQRRFLALLMRMIRRLERLSRRRFRWIFNRRGTNSLYGLATIALSTAAFVAPPFSGLDTLPALGAVVLSLGILLEDVVLVVAGLLIGAAGVLVEVLLGKAAVDAVKGLLG